LPRGGIVRVLPTPRVAPKRTSTPVAGHPSLQLTTVSTAQPRRDTSNGAPPDTTPPAVSCQTIDRGWHGDNVTISCSADDAGSGIADAGDGSFTLSTHVAAGVEDPHVATDSRTVCDIAGNCARASAVALAIDRRAPSISCDAPDRSWQPANQTISCTTTDAGSGLADAGSHRLTLRTSVADGAEDPAASTGSRQVCDAAGNCATAGPLTGLRIDRKAPRLRLSQTPNGAHGWFKQAPAVLDAFGQDDQLARVTCLADPDNAAARTSASGPKSATLQLSADGAHHVTCTAVDLAGNSTSATSTVQIDTTAPSLSLTTDHSSYGVDDTVTVTCGASDSLSGVTGRDCPAHTIPASTLALGSNRLTAAATDDAGNQTGASTSFDVTVSVTSLGNLTHRLVSDAQAEPGLIAELKAVDLALDGVAKAAAVKAYQDHVRALPAQSVGADDAATLIRFAAGL
jgi:hypothetical protein